MVMREQAFGEVFRAAADHREVNHLLQKVRAHSTVRRCEFARTLVYVPDPIILTLLVAGFPFKPIDKVPFTPPFWVGVKVTLIVQLAPAESDVRQLFAWV
jgi:hypothetical protein